MLRFLMALCLSLTAASAQAFCGFYVAKADSSLFNQSSKVVYFREGDLSVITMASDYRGEPADFAMIVPTPVVLPRPSVRTVPAKTVQHLDDYTAPRLVEYHDGGPWCGDIEFVVVEEAPGAAPTQRERARAQGVTIAAKYAVGDYDILILKAEQSDGLATFLTDEGYTLPEGAAPVLNDYIKMGMKFFVAKVNLSRHAAGESRDLPPLQIRFRSRDFMLPIQLGKVNADGPQDVLMYMLSRKGRVEPVNYKAVDLPTDFDVPAFVENQFPAFYRALFTKAAPKGGGIVLEYAWDMGWCDPCAADPLTGAELRELGVTRLTGKEEMVPDIYVTRLHARYAAGQMTQDITFRETENRQNFQGRFVIRHAYTGDFDLGDDPTAEDRACLADYVTETKSRLRAEGKRLAEVTGWPLSEINTRLLPTIPERYR